MAHGQRWVFYGDARVAVHERDWPVAPSEPYRKTYRLRPGQHWQDAELSTSVRARYALVDAEVVPVGVAIAREAMAKGAAWAYATEQWAGTVVLVGPDLRCVALDGAVGELVEELRLANGGVLGGLTDVVGRGADGRVLLREARNLDTREGLGSQQHGFARAAHERFGPDLDLAVVEWGGVHAPHTAAAPAAAAGTR
jgi:hypothetical protein